MKNVIKARYDNTNRCSFCNEIKQPLMKGPYFINICKSCAKLAYEYLKNEDLKFEGLKKS